MRIDISLSTNSLNAKLAQIQREMPAAVDVALYATAQFGENLILDRTRKGRGISGAFKPYSVKYAAFRQDKGRGNTVDLNFTGSMLGAMTAQKNRGYAEIKFSRASESRKAYFNNKRRPFFGFNATEKKRLIEFMKRRLFK